LHPRNREGSGSCVKIGFSYGGAASQRVSATFRTQRRASNLVVIHKYNAQKKVDGTVCCTHSPPTTLTIPGTRGKSTSSGQESGVGGGRELKTHSETCAFGGIPSVLLVRIQREFQRASWVDGTIHFSQVVAVWAWRDEQIRIVLRNDSSEIANARRTGKLRREMQSFR